MSLCHSLNVLLCRMDCVVVMAQLLLVRQPLMLSMILDVITSPVAAECMHCTLSLHCNQGPCCKRKLLCSAGHSVGKKLHVLLATAAAGASGLAGCNQLVGRALKAAMFDIQETVSMILCLCALAV